MTGSRRAGRTGHAGRAGRAGHAGRVGRSLCGGALALAGVLAGPADAGGATACAMAGPAPGFDVIRLDLPRGNTSAEVRLVDPPSSAPVGSSASAYFIEGVGIISARTGRLLAARVGSWGPTPRRVTVRANGADLVAQDSPVLLRSPIQRTTTASSIVLRPGRYYVVGFGTDGDPRPPNPTWGAELRLAGRVTCGHGGSGSVFFADQTAFRGGTQASAYGPAVVDGATYHWRTSRPLVFGLVAATVEGAGHASMAFTFPRGRHGMVSNDLLPFTSGTGRYTLRASAEGPYASTVFAGVALTP